MVDPVDDVPDVVEIARDLGELGLSSRRRDSSRMLRCGRAMIAFKSAQLMVINQEGNRT